MKILSIIALAFGLIILPSDKLVVQKYRMDGKYGLYVKMDGQNWVISWMTPIAEACTVFDVNGSEENKIGETASSTIHRFELSASSSPQVIKFGGEKSGYETLMLNQQFDRAPFEFEEVDSLYVFGDTHGNYKFVIDILREQKIINDQLEWMGGKSHLVFVGDILDRGDDALRLAWFIKDLEENAQTRGGKVHLVLGNHEIMVMSNDDRYVSAKERQIANLYNIPYGELFHPKNTLIGKWMTSKPAVLKIDETIFAHGGLIMNEKIEKINQQTHEFLHHELFTKILDDSLTLPSTEEKRFDEIREFFYNAYSPFWYRGYVQSDTTGAYLDFVLTKNKGRLHVVGHTSRPNIEQKFKGKLIATNVHKAGSELLLLVRKKKKYSRFKIDMEGNVEEL